MFTRLRVNNHGRIQNTLQEIVVWIKEVITTNGAK